MSNYTDNLEYSLAKRVPDMERGFTLRHQARTRRRGKWQ